MKVGYRALVCAGLLGAFTAQAQETRTVWIMGDSIMRAVSRSLEREMTRVGGFTPFSLTSIGTGLARLDLYDWHAQMRKAMEEHKPDLVIIMMGANDNQAMHTGSEIVRPRTPEWDREYAERVEKAIDILLQGGAKEIHWVELPDMRDTRLQEDIERINQIVKDQCATHPSVTFESVQALLSRKPGEYSAYVLQSNGMPLDIRSGDGVHLNRNGSDLLAKELVRRLTE